MICMGLPRAVGDDSHHPEGEAGSASRRTGRNRPAWTAPEDSAVNTRIAASWDWRRRIVSLRRST